MEKCRYFNNGLCEKVNKSVSVLDTEENISCYCVEHDILRVLQKCEYFSPIEFGVAFRNETLSRIKDIKSQYSIKTLRTKKANPLYDEQVSIDFTNNSQHLGNLIVLLQQHNFAVVPRSVRKQVYDIMIELKMPLDKDMKLDKNKILKKC